MRIRTVIVIVIVAAALAAAYLRFMRPNAGDATGPNRAVAKFYTNWLAYSDEAPTRQTLLDRLYAANPNVTNELTRKLDSILTDFDTTGYDPVTCAPVRPDRFTIDGQNTVGNIATVTVAEQFGDSTQRVAVHLQRDGANWWITDIDCAPETQAVKLFYYREDADRERNNGAVACDPEAVLPIERRISSENLITDTLSLLIAGVLSPAERDQGFSTEFPNAGFHLESTQLDGGVLTLTFSEVPGFTTGGACRVGLLRAEIEKTALQFPDVRTVRFEPETLFQP